MQRTLIAIMILTVPGAALALPAGTTNLSDADITLTGEANGDGAGFDLDVVGDLDGDGNLDFAVGAPLEATGAASAGAFYLLYGPLASGTIDLADADAKIVGAEGDFVGEGFSNIGDIDGDGYDDLAVGAPGPFLGPVLQPSVVRPGQVHIIYGGSVRLDGTLTATTIADATLVGNLPMDWVGLSNARKVDLDGDGLHDLVLSLNGPGATQGPVYILYGNAQRFSSEVQLVTNADASIHGVPDDRLGLSITHGDLDGDGEIDLVIGAPGLLSLASHVHVFYGTGQRLSGPVLAAAADATLLAEAVGDFASQALAAGDLDGDGYDDLVVGASQWDQVGGRPGKVYVLYGGAQRLAGPAVLSSADAVLEGDAPDDRAGYALDVADVDGDGYAEMIVGARGSDASGDGAGAVYVVPGSAARLSGTSNVGTLASSILTGDAAGDAAGAVVAIDDVNGDGTPDVLVGAPGNPFGAADRPGAAHIVFG